MDMPKNPPSNAIFAKKYDNYGQPAQILQPQIAQLQQFLGA